MRFTAKMLLKSVHSFGIGMITKCFQLNKMLAPALMVLKRLFGISNCEVEPLKAICS